MSVNVLAPMLGATITKIEGEKGSGQMAFYANDGRLFRFYHAQDCCESVGIEDVCGDLADLIGSPLVEAEEVSSDGTPAPKDADSYSWTFYRFGTAKGSVTVRWLGESNGYYSESVDFEVEGSLAGGDPAGDGK
jgi:hypothetical protein